MLNSRRLWYQLALHLVLGSFNMIISTSVAQLLNSSWLQALDSDDKENAISDANINKDTLPYLPESSSQKETALTMAEVSCASKQQDHQMVSCSLCQVPCSYVSTFSSLGKRWRHRIATVWFELGSWRPSWQSITVHDPLSSGFYSFLLVCLLESMSLI
jgi:hypothetical protein